MSGSSYEIDRVLHRIIRNNDDVRQIAQYYSNGMLSIAEALRAMACIIDRCGGEAESLKGH